MDEKIVMQRHSSRVTKVPKGKPRGLNLMLLSVLITGGLFAGSLTAGENETAITTWLPIFNNPDACEFGSGEPGEPACVPGPARDFGIPAVVASVCWLAGHVGEGSDHACLFGPGLVDADAAEIHIVLQEHGSSLPSGDGLETRVSQAGGECNPACIDTQASLHLPGDADPVSVSPMLRLPESDLSVIPGTVSTLFREDDGVRVVIHTRLED